MELDLTEALGNVRSKRYALIHSVGTIKPLFW